MTHSAVNRDGSERTGVDRTACQHRREHHSLLAAAERRVLTWIAQRLPPRITSDHLSAVGLVSMLVVGVGFAAYRATAWAAVVVVLGLVVNWFGDSLDGTVARVRGLERPRYGYYVDHVIDLAGTTFLFAGLAGSGLMSPLLAMILLSAYFLVCAETYLATHAVSAFRMSFFGVGPTELRIVLGAGALKASGGAWITLGGSIAVRLFDIGAVVATVGLVVAFITAASTNTRTLSELEPLPTRARSAA